MALVNYPIRFLLSKWMPCPWKIETMFKIFSVVKFWTHNSDSTVDGTSKNKSNAHHRFPGNRLLPTVMRVNNILCKSLRYGRVPQPLQGIRTMYRYLNYFYKWSKKKESECSVAESNNELKVNTCWSVARDWYFDRWCHNNMYK